ncbi:hypothetical protein FE257_007630 [Aspergillus nanangensis]|uniref:Ketoreductase domain-containing protein n=1 Tax=Aspergillus nanangensis TaxID=2582783 RepID=A0AAD4CMG6_ASPNN|nr:hypothetical protein FE257_007630 [Aspergillus nanangensis]
MATPSRMPGVALITGAASGIGRATAHTFVKEGCSRLVLADRNATSLQGVCAELKALDASVQTLAVTVDVSSETEVGRLIDKAVERFGAIHYAVNNAGITSPQRVRTHELDTASWDRVVEVNLRGAWLCQRAEIRQMLKQGLELESRTGSPAQRGAIVNIASIFGILSHPTVGGYAASKAGVLGMTRTDAIAYGKDGIRINSVLPGFINTPLMEESIRRGSNYETFAARVPLTRMGRAEEIAEAVVFLTSEKASYISGSEMVVDGGKRYSSL